MMNEEDPGRIPIAAAGADLLRQRFGNAFVDWVGGFRAVNQLAVIYPGKSRLRMRAEQVASWRLQTDI